MVRINSLALGILSTGCLPFKRKSSEHINHFFRVALEHYDWCNDKFLKEFSASNLVLTHSAKFKDTPLTTGTRKGTGAFFAVPILSATSCIIPNVI